MTNTKNMLLLAVLNNRSCYVEYCVQRYQTLTTVVNILDLIA